MMTTKTKVIPMMTMAARIRELLKAPTYIEVEDGATVVCDGGWGGFHHNRIVLTLGASNDISHGMCERCRLLSDAELDGLTGEGLVEYHTYLARTLDPRD